jgi:hypothetical protein
MYYQEISDFAGRFTHPGELDLRSLVAKNRCQRKVETVLPKDGTKCLVQERGALKHQASNEIGLLWTAIAVVCAPFPCFEYAMHEGQMRGLDYLTPLLPNDLRE